MNTGTEYGLLKYIYLNWIWIALFLERYASHLKNPISKSPYVTLFHTCIKIAMFTLLKLKIHETRMTQVNTVSEGYVCLGIIHFLQFLLYFFSFCLSPGAILTYLSNAIFIFIFKQVERKKRLYDNFSVANISTFPVGKGSRTYIIVCVAYEISRDAST